MITLLLSLPKPTEILNLSNNQIQDIKVLSDLINLKKLYLSNNKIDDISLLSNMTNLQGIDLSNNQIKEIEELSNLTNLQRLYFIIKRFFFM